eukprot:8131460-Alexandrium_andersonii.AAC.1
MGRGAAENPTRRAPSAARRAPSPGPRPRGRKPQTGSRPDQRRTHGPGTPARAIFKRALQRSPGARPGGGS